MSNDIEQLLDENGWVLECMLPLEIRHTESGSFATGLAAKYVIAALTEEQEGDSGCCLSEEDEDEITGR